MDETESGKQDAMETDAPKKVRKRQKKLCFQIRQQMEFYFSQANLQKDRFLGKLTDSSDDGYIDISVFAKFNKLKALTEDMSLVAKALSTSDLIQVSDDKQKLRRSKPLADGADVDDRTIYVECLPSGIDHEWVKSVFQPCGKVLYVSLPKYRITKDIKGFAFVEFETVLAAKKACQLMNNPPSGAGDRIGKFPHGNKDFKRLERQLRNRGGELECRDPRLARRSKRTLSESAATEDGDTLPKRKRPRRNSEGADTLDDQDHRLHGHTGDKPTQEPDVEAARDEESTKQSDVNTESKSNSESRKRKLSESESSSSSSESEPQQKSTAKVRISSKVDMKSPEQQTHKKKRKRNKKRVKEVVKVEIPELRVIPKHDWLSLKHEYLQLQKEGMKQLKTTLREHQHERKNKRKKDVDNKESSSKETEKSTARERDIEFQPDVVLRVTCKSGSLLIRKEVKEHAAKLASVAYADVKDEATEGVIRCTSSEDANKLIQAKDDVYTYSLIQGDEEKQYWDKIKADRDYKMNSKGKSQKKRGRDKIYRKAEKILETHQKKHVVFDD